ncbi:MAG: TonB-dependent receptor [Pseudoxanthomonas sp.]
MNSRITQLALGILAALHVSGAALAAEQAQGREPDQDGVVQADTVTVTGYRASLEKSQAVKRNANSIVDAISAEDIGKFPDINAAESLSHLPGITVDRQFGEGEKVSINGTDPALNRVLLNGQTIASGDWGGNPTDTSGRTFNYTLLSPEIIGLMEVYKTPEARIDEGSIGGTVIVHTRKPLELDKNTLTGSIGYNYNDRSEEGNPRGSALWSWKNDAETFGFLVSAGREEQTISRAGIEYWGYNEGVGDTVAVTGEGDRSTVKVPAGIASSYFQQDRRRDGVQTALQWRPDERNELNLTGIYVKGKYDNYSQSRYVTPGQMTSATIADGYVTSGRVDGDAYAQHDFNQRNSEVETRSLHLRHDYNGDKWVLTTQVGNTSAKGGRDPEYLMKALLLGGGFDFSYDDRHAVVNYDNPDASNWGLIPGVTDNAQYGGIFYETSRDEERYLQFDAARDVSWGPVTKILFGSKYTNHENSVSSRSNSVFVTSPFYLSDVAGGMSPSGLYDGLGAGGDLSSFPIADLGAAMAYFNTLPQGEMRYNYGPSFFVKEITRAFYAQANFEWGKWRGNLGLRYIDTTDKSLYWVSGADGYDRARGNQEYKKPLPSFNLAYEISQDMVARFSAAKVIARPRYGQLAGTLDLDDAQFTGGGGNPDLKPYEATNFDLAYEWYFAPSSMLGAEVFHRDITNYVVTATSEVLMSNPNPNSIYYNDPQVYSISRPVNVSDAKATGLSLIYQQAFDNGLGINANYTYTDTSTSSDLFLPYVSEHAYTITPYYEKGPYSVRLNYSWRSEYFTQIGRQSANVYTDAYKQLDLTVGYEFNEHVGLRFSATNLLDDTYYSYDTDPRAPLGLYKSGRNYQAALNVKF